MRRIALAVPLLVSSAAHAQSVQLDDFRPALDSRGYLTLNASETLDDRELSFGLGSLEWGHRMLALPSAYAVDDMVSATLVAAFGVHAGPVPLEVGASLPFTIVNGNGKDGQGVGDFGAHVKARLAHAGPFGLAAIGSLYVPTTSTRDPFLGESALTPQLVGVADATLGPLRIALNGGVRWRRTSSFSAMDATGTMQTVTASTELPVGVGVAWALAPQKVELVGEVFGAVPLGAHHGYQPLEALGGIKVYLAKSSYLSLGAGRGLLATEAGNPDMRAVIGIVFEPRPAQRAAARIPDDDTRVAVADPPKHDDGWHDRDNDGIRDEDDRCPDDPENYNGVEDEDGCPDHDLTVETETEIVPLEPIEFEFDKAVIRPSSYTVLNAVVAALRNNPDIDRIEVQGHTDEQGDDAYNLDLSNRRAAAVVAYLTAHGIAAARLTSQGYGETQPVDPAHTRAAYAKNRRVAFVITSRRGVDP